VPTDVIAVLPAPGGFVVDAAHGGNELHVGAMSSVARIRNELEAAHRPKIPMVPRAHGPAVVHRLERVDAGEPRG
jgi:hypothetical protein